MYYCGGIYQYNSDIFVDGICELSYDHADAIKFMNEVEAEIVIQDAFQYCGGLRLEKDIVGSVGYVLKYVGWHD